MPGVTRSRTYGALLSLFDAGGAASAALSAALASGEAYGVWDGLARLVYICAAVAVAPLGVLCFVGRPSRYSGEDAAPPARSLGS